MEWSKKNRKAVLGIVFAGIIFYVALQRIEDIGGILNGFISLIFPFILGSAIAFILNVPMKKIEGRLFRKSKKLEKYRRVCAYLLMLILVFLVLIAGMFIVIPELINTCNSLVEQIPEAFSNMEEQIAKLQNEWSALQSLPMDFTIDWDKIVDQIVTLIQNGVSGLLNSTFNVVGNIISGIMTFFIGFTFSIYLLFQKEKLGVQVKKLCYAFFPEKIADKIVYISRLSHTTFSNFISGQCMEAVILGMMFFVAMSIFRMPYALLMGVLIAITALIPIFGAFIGCAIGIFLIAMVNPMQAIGFIILFFVLQQLEGNFIYPYVVGGKVGLPSFLVLVAVTIGGKTMGIAGMLIFIPASSVCYALLRELTYGKLKEKEVSDDKFAVVEEIPEPKKVRLKKESKSK